MKWLRATISEVVLRRTADGRSDTWPTVFGNMADRCLETTEAVFGGRVVNGYHVPAVLPRPGVGVFFNRYGASNNVVVSWIEGVVNDDDVAQIVEVVREGMGWAKRS